jgi:membrane protein implicated in regulation of membrane protease activity
MADYIWWIVIAAVLLGVELATGAYYLLALSIAAAVTAIAAYFGVGTTAQLLLAAVTAVISVSIAHRFRKLHQSSSSVQDNPDVHADIGQTVTVSTWDAQGKGQTFYRGAHWQTSLEGPRSETHTYRVVRIDGIRLVVCAS